MSGETEDQKIAWRKRIAEWMRRPLWPWPLVVAHRQGEVIEDREKSLLLEIIEEYPAQGMPISEFAGSAPMHVIAESFRFSGYEEQNKGLHLLEQPILTDLINRTLVGWARRSEQGKLEPVEATEWIGGEVLYRRDCRLIRSGFRLQQGNYCASEEPEVWLFDIHVTRTSILGATAEPSPTSERCLKDGRNLSNEAILSKADEMHARPMRVRDIAKMMCKEPGFEDAQNERIRDLTKGRYARPGRAGIKSAE